MEDPAKISEGTPDPPSEVKPATPGSGNPPIPVEPQAGTSRPIQPPTTGGVIATTQGDRVGGGEAESSLGGGSTVSPLPTTRETEPTPVPVVEKSGVKQTEMAVGGGANGGEVLTCPEDSTGYDPMTTLSSFEFPCCCVCVCVSPFFCHLCVCVCLPNPNVLCLRSRTTFPVW